MKRCIIGLFVAATTATAALALASPLLMAMPGPAAARDCSQIEEKNERSECLDEEYRRISLELKVHICARELTKNALATLGLEMGFTARTTPAEIVTAFGAHPERQARRLDQAMRKAAEGFNLMIYYLIVAEDEREREVLAICVEKMSDQDIGAVIEERLKPPATAQPVNLDWLDGVLAGLDEPPALEAAQEPEPPPAPVDLGVDCTEPFTVNLPDDVLTE